MFPFNIQSRLFASTSDGYAKNKQCFNYKYHKNRIIRIHFLLESKMPTNPH